MLPNAGQCDANNALTNFWNSVGHAMVEEGLREMTEPTSDSTTITIDVIKVDRVNRGSLMALASAVIDIDGIEITIHGIQVRRKNPKTGLTAVTLPAYRGPDGSTCQALDLPHELWKPLGDAVLAAVVQVAENGGLGAKAAGQDGQVS